MLFLKFSKHFLVGKVFKIVFLGHYERRNAILNEHLDFPVRGFFLIDEAYF